MGFWFSSFLVSRICCCCCICEFPIAISSPSLAILWLRQTFIFFHFLDFVLLSTETEITWWLTLVFIPHQTTTATETDLFLFFFYTRKSIKSNKLNYHFFLYIHICWYIILTVVWFDFVSSNKFAQQIFCFSFYTRAKRIFCGWWSVCFLFVWSSSIYDFLVINKSFE